MVDSTKSTRVEGSTDRSVNNKFKYVCLLYTSDAADERSSVDLGGRRIIKKKKHVDQYAWADIEKYNKHVLTLRRNKL